MTIILILMKISFLINEFYKLLYYDRIDLSEGTGLTKSNNNKECIICHCWLF